LKLDTTVKSSPMVISADGAIDVGPPAGTAIVWSYGDEVDPMTDAHTYTACTRSTAPVRLLAPYEDTSAQLCVRQSKKFGLDAYIVLDGSGQILCGYDSCPIPARFDSGSVVRLDGGEPSDHSTNIKFLRPAASVVRRLRGTRRARFDLTFYDAGVQTLEFNTNGFDWKH
jgi:hypothetical protein